MKIPPTTIPFNPPQISILFSVEYRTIFIRIFWIRLTLAWRWYLDYYRSDTFISGQLGPIGASFTWREKKLKITIFEP